jgi:hypothetical protein
MTFCMPFWGPFMPFCMPHGFLIHDFFTQAHLHTCLQYKL